MNKRDAAFAYLGCEEYRSTHGNDLESMTRQAVYRAIPHSRTGKSMPWSEIEDELLDMGRDNCHEAPSAYQRETARQAISDAQMVFEESSSVYSEDLR